VRVPDDYRGGCLAGDTYTVVTEMSLTGITGFRMELMTDPPLPTGGPGLNGGNIVLSEMTVDAVPAQQQLPPNKT
jgi:hypothetical protein